MPVDRLLVFTLGTTPFALRLSEVAGVMEPAGIRRIPGAAAPVLGLCEWRGRILTVLDLPRLLGVEPRGATGNLIRLRPPFQRTALWIPASVAIRTGILEDEAADSAVQARADDHEPSPRLLDTTAIVAAAAAEARDRSRTEPPRARPW